MFKAETSNVFPHKSLCHQQATESIMQIYSAINKKRVCLEKLTDTLSNRFAQSISCLYAIASNKLHQVRFTGL